MNLFGIGSSGEIEAAGLIPLATPSSIGVAQTRFLRRLRLHAILLEAGEEDADAPLVRSTFLERAAREGIRLVSIGPPALAWSSVAPELSLCAVSPAEEARAIAANVPRTALVSDASDDLSTRLEPLLLSPWVPGKADRPLRGALLKASLSPPLCWFTTDRFEEIRTIEDLELRLGKPATILCLGNGPSSEDPEVEGLAYDALFRVNHAWLERGLLTAPDVIFTGKRDTLLAYRAATIFAVQTEYAMRKIMLRSFGLSRRRRPIFSTDRLGCMDSASFGTFKPSNGAAMIATAAALDPAHLIVAGLDLFSDSRGAYPGQNQTPNAYTPTHNRDSEEVFLLETLSRVTGKVTVIGPVLKERFARYLEDSSN